MADPIAPAVPAAPAAPAAGAGAPPAPAAPAAPAAGAPPPAAPAAGAPPAQPPAPEQKPPAAPAAGAPAALELKLPEGAKFDEKVLGEFKTLMSDEKLSPSQRAQALIDLQFKQASEQHKAIEKAVADQQVKDVETLKADKEFGGVQYERTLAAAKSALAQFGGEEASKLFTDYGIANNPVVMKLLARVRSAISEDKVSGLGNLQPAANTRETQLQNRYSNSPGMFKKQ